MNKLKTCACRMFNRIVQFFYENEHMVMQKTNFSLRALHTGASRKLKLVVRSAHGKTF